MLRCGRFFKKGPTQRRSGCSSIATMSATLTYLYDPGVVTVELVGEHGKFTSSLHLAGPEISDDEVPGVSAVATIVRAGHHQDFACDCEITVIVNGKLPTQ